MSTSVIHEAWSSRSEDVRRRSVWGFRKFGEDFSDDSMDRWLVDVRRESYKPGSGTWTSCRVYLYPDSDGRLETFDVELIERDGHGHLTDRPADARTWLQDLKAFPRTPDNIRQWMWEVFRAEDVTPPVYNPELTMVEWANKRLPVSENGTDFSVEPVIIDPSREPGVFARIGKR